MYKTFQMSKNNRAKLSRTLKLVVISRRHQKLRLRRLPKFGGVRVRRAAALSRARSAPLVRLRGTRPSRAQAAQLPVRLRLVTTCPELIAWM